MQILCKRIRSIIRTELLNKMEHFKPIPLDPLTQPLPLDSVTRPHTTPDASGYNISEWSEFLSIQELWNEMGLEEEPERLHTRSMKLKENCHLLLGNILKEEQKVLQQVKENIRSFTSEVNWYVIKIALY